MSGQALTTSALMGCGLLWTSKGTAMSIALPISCPEAGEQSSDVNYLESGREDSNLRPPAPKSGHGEKPWPFVLLRCGSNLGAAWVSADCKHYTDYIACGRFQAVIATQLHADCTLKKCVAPNRLRIVSSVL